MILRKITNLDPGVLAIQIALCDKPGCDSGISQKGAYNYYVFYTSFFFSSANPNPNLSLGPGKGSQSIRGVKERFG